ncbi:hypothetical protein PCC7424_0126 [Gloeothece citriformis PCC 7424]|uniref:Uncharacterized protein n=1 Tax=Gloeothece citriformis (strain PCC 7424) TaxID=65393 RepID=B7K9B3_GLOC7|nr:hypothetical protein PCC7424_0126 [Gloeothece citriformis PCC 7424]
MPKLTEVGIIVVFLIVLTFTLSLFAKESIVNIWADILKIGISGYLGFLTRSLTEK